jgi:acyl-CoA reductase-like NAD-dependent aldehyde dehydrogenase
MFDVEENEMAADSTKFIKGQAASNGRHNGYNGIGGNGQRRVLPFVNPATGESFGQVLVATPAEVQTARREMGAAAPAWAARPVKERVRILRQLQQVMIDRIDEITAVINQDSGKSRQDALAEIFVTVNVIDEYCKHAPRWLRRRRASTGLQIFKRGYVQQKPYGVVGIIGPWNYPLLLQLSPIISALLAGNTVLVKPSEVTAATGVLMAELCQSVPELAPFVRFLHGDGQVGAALVDSRPDMVFLTGSTQTGRLVMQKAAETLTPVACELGGKDPMIVLDDADLEAAARWGVWGAMYNAGQSCVAVERVYVLDEVYDEFVRQTVAQVSDLKVGYSAQQDNENDLGPLTFERQIEIIEDHLQDALEKGATLLLGGQREGMYMEPTVLLDVDHTMRIMQEETFGPIMPIMRVKSEREAIYLANDSDLGLSASVWSRDLKRAQRVASQLEVGSVNINDTISHFGMPRLLFGGIKQSGIGRIHGRRDLLQFTYSQAQVAGNPPPSFDVATIMREPGNYNLGRAIIQAAFGVTPAQRLRPLTERLPVEVDETAVDKGVKIAGVVLGALAAVTAVWRLVKK